MNRIAIIGIGIPGSGKTSYLKPLALEQSLLYVSADELRQQFTGDMSNHSKDTAVWQTVFKRIQQSLNSNKYSGVVVDATHAKFKDRRKSIIACQNYGATDVIGYWFDTDLDIALARNANRSRSVPEQAIKKMNQSLQQNPPSITDGFSRIHKLANN
jgi:predicted kinase